MASSLKTSLAGHNKLVLSSLFLLAITFGAYLSMTASDRTFDSNIKSTAQAQHMWSKSIRLEQRAQAFPFVASGELKVFASSPTRSYIFCANSDEPLLLEPFAPNGHIKAVVELDGRLIVFNESPETKGGVLYKVYSPNKVLAPSPTSQTLPDQVLTLSSRDSGKLDPSPTFRKDIIGASKHQRNESGTVVDHLTLVSVITESAANSRGVPLSYVLLEEFHLNGHQILESTAKAEKQGISLRKATVAPVSDHLRLWVPRVGSVYEVDWPSRFQNDLNPSFLLSFNPRPLPSSLSLLERLLAPKIDRDTLIGLGGDPISTMHLRDGKKGWRIFKTVVAADSDGIFPRRPFASLNRRQQQAIDEHFRLRANKWESVGLGLAPTPGGGTLMLQLEPQNSPESRWGYGLYYKTTGTETFDLLIQGELPDERERLAAYKNAYLTAFLWRDQCMLVLESQSSSLPNTWTYDVTRFKLQPETNVGWDSDFIVSCSTDVLSEWIWR